MIRPLIQAGCLGMGLMLVLILAGGPGCREAKPPLSPKAAVFTKEVQAVIERVAPPLTEPVSREDREGAQKALKKAFSVCADACEGLFYNVIILDQQGVLTAVYPPAEVKSLQFAGYKAVQKAFAEKKPNQAILYLPNGTPIDIIFVPLIQQDKAVGLLALGFEGNLVKEKRGLGEQEFLSLEFQSPGGQTGQQK